MTGTAARKSNRLSKEDREEIEAIARIPVVISAQGLKLLADLAARKVKERERKERGIARNHPNWGRAAPHQTGRWVWGDEVQATPAEAASLRVALKPHRSGAITAKRQHRIDVVRYERELEFNEARDFAAFVRSFDRSEMKAIEQDVERRWLNATQRPRRRAQRLAKRLAASSAE